MRERLAELRLLRVFGVVVDAAHVSGQAENKTKCASVRVFEGPLNRKPSLISLVSLIALPLQARIFAGFASIPENEPQ